MPKAEKNTKWRRIRGAGFTLIELLVVLAVISFLVAVVLSSVKAARAKARDAARIEDFDQFRIALALHYDKYGMYPCGDANDSGTDDTAQNPYGTWDTSASDGFLNHTHGRTVANCVPGGAPEGIYPEFYPVYQPKDPVNTDWAGNLFYRYVVSADRQTYVLTAVLENNPSLMENDGGYCLGRYEVRDGRTPTPGRWGQTLFNSCK